MIKTSFFRKILFSFLFLTLVGISIFSLYAYFPLRRSFLRSVESNLSVSALVLSERFSRNLIPENQREINQSAKKFASDLGIRITVVDKSGKVWADSEKNPLQMENHRNRPEIKVALSGRTGTSIRRSPTLGINMMYVAIPLRKNGKIIGILRTSLPLLEINEKMKSINKTIGIAAFFSFLLALIMSTFFARGLSKPLLRIANFADEVIKGNIKKRLPPTGKDEFSVVSELFNAMLDKLEFRLLELRIEKEKLSIFIESARETIIGLDKDGKIILFNHEAENLFGFADNSALGHYLWEVVRSKEITAPVSNFFRNNALTKRISSFHTPKGKTFEFRMSPVFSGKENSGLLLIAYDLTQEKRVQEMRKTFVANASHELRSPLSTLRVVLETLQEESGKDKKNKHFLSLAERQVLRLQNLTDDLLTLSIVESKSPDTTGKIDIYMIVKELRSEFEARARGKKQSLVFQLSPDLPSARGEKRGIEQIFSNLLDNAIKFTQPGGKITLVATENKGKIQIELSDNGTGIPETDLEKIFERFYRVDKARSRALGGTGLGLSIVKHIVESYGGHIWAESKLGEGSSFFFTLPTV